MASVQRLRPTKILLVTRDRRFASVASFLFTRRGIEVDAPHALTLLSHLVEICRPSIAVVDIDTFSRVHERLQVPVILVGEDVSGSGYPDVLEKWGSFEHLLEVVERCEGEIGASLSASVPV